MALSLMLLAMQVSAADVVGAFKAPGAEDKPLQGNVLKGVKLSPASSGKLSPTMQFSGEGRVEIAEETLNFPGSFTIEFDLQMGDLHGNPYLLSKRSKVQTDIQSGYWIELIAMQNDPGFKSGQVFLDFFAGGATARATLKIDKQKKYHVVAVHKELADDKGINLLFVDDQQKGVGDCKANCPANDAPLTLGNYINGYHEFNGSISGLSVSPSAALPVSAQGTLPAGASGDAKTNTIPDHVIGERDSLVKLVSVVQATLAKHELLNEAMTQSLTAISDAGSKATTLESLATQRTKLGQLVGKVAAQYYGRDFIVWKHNRWADLSAHDWPDSKPGDSIDLRCALAGNAFGSQAIAISNTQSAPTSVEVSADAVGKDAPSIKVRRGWQVSCPDLAFRPDPLALAENGKITLQPGETTFVWFEISSHDVRAGQYALPITIKSSNSTALVKLSVDVADVRMPEVLDCILFNYSYLDEMGFIRKYKAEAIEDLRRHYINSFVIPMVPEVKADDEGNLVGVLDFTRVDAQIAMYRPHAKKLIFFWGANVTADLNTFPNLKFLSDPWKKALVAFYQQWVRHLGEMGLTPDDYIMYPFDETSRPAAKEVYEVLKSVEPQVKLLLNPTTGYKRAELEAIAPVVDYWQPSFEAMVKPHPEDYEFLRSTGKDCWTYSCANGTPMPTYDYNLARHWAAWKLGMKGVSQWCYADHGGWESDNSWKFVRGAFAMVYARENAPADLPLPEALTPSRRWEAWREGAQDYQLLNMAKAKAANSPELAAAVKKLVSNVVDHPEDLVAADHSRAELLRLLSNQQRPE
jgi:hypothetical protein